MQRLRDRRGLTRGACETIGPWTGSGPSEASTETLIEVAGNAVRLIVDEIERLPRERVPEGELEAVKVFVIPSFSLPGGMAAAISGANVAPSEQ